MITRGTFFRTLSASYVRPVFGASTWRWTWCQWALGRWWCCCSPLRCCSRFADTAAVRHMTHGLYLSGFIPSKNNEHHLKCCWGVCNNLSSMSESPACFVLSLRRNHLKQENLNNFKDQQNIWKLKKRERCSHLCSCFSCSLSLCCHRPHQLLRNSHILHRVIVVLKVWFLSFSPNS